MDTSVTLTFGDGEYRFFLPMARIVEIERKCGDRSIEVMYQEMGQSLGIDPETEAAVYLGGGSSRIRDVSEVIRCGAIGGGECRIGKESRRVSPIDAEALVNNYVDGRPFSETVPVAWAILNATLHGVRLKKKADKPASQKRSAKAS